MLASQLGAPISHISEQKGADLLAIKKRLGLPDIRFDELLDKQEQAAHPELQNSIAPISNPGELPTVRLSKSDMDAIVKAVTDAVVTAIGKK